MCKGPPVWPSKAAQACGVVARTGDFIQCCRYCRTECWVVSGRCLGAVAVSGPLTCRLTSGVEEERMCRVVS
eukprot:scaffold129883_cov60-Phaeocystis_antarctica.AAC.1